MMETNQIIQGDVLEVLKTLPDDFVDCVVTSPPYFGLRDYGVEGQLGLEKTPDEYVAKMVEVFYEVKRVLKKEGTVWLNLGDSYWGGGFGTSPGGNEDFTERYPKQASNRGTQDHETIKKLGALKKHHSTLKPKDLVGIPWRVAFALQQPYYTGTVKDEKDRVWLAAMLDGEGCFYIHKRKKGQHAGDGYFRQDDNYQPAFEVANTDKSIIDRCFELTKVGSVTRQDKDRRQPIYRWHVRSNESRAIIAEIYPYLVAKKQQARICYGIEPHGEKTQKGWEGLKSLHAGLPCETDYPAPPSLYEPGWFLRQDVIWSKPNPMPESVTDRCTKSHEYIFLLTKSSKYYFDSEAMKEKAVWDLDGNGTIKRADRQKEGLKSNPDAWKNGIRHKNLLEKGQTPHTMHKLRVVYPNGKHADGQMSPKTISGFRNRRSVWSVTTKPYKEAHFATFPEKLIEPMVLAGCPKGGVVLDPFIGSGTTAYVARKLGRNYLGIELNPEYIKLIENRLRQQLLI